MKHLHLPLNRSLVPAGRIADLYVRCRAAAHQIDPHAHLSAVYQDHERVGWDVIFCTDEAVQKMISAYRRITAGEPLLAL